MSYVSLLCFVGSALLAMISSPVFASTPASPCERPAAGSAAVQPADLFSINGTLDVTLNYETTLDSADRTLFCLVTPKGQESPTLHVRPGDTLNITLHNDLPSVTSDAAAPMTFGPDFWGCGWPTMTSTSVNLHFHGTNTRPICHSDQVIYTLVNSGKTYTYHVTFPADEPPGLYWYHPHVHGLSEAALLGGATGAIVVEGIEAEQPIVAGLPERTLIIRDQNVAGNPQAGGSVPSWDVSLNFVPVSYPDLTPAVITVSPGKREFWRVANTSADTIVDLDLKYDGVQQELKVVGLDGVPTGSHDVGQPGVVLKVNHIFLPPGGRAELVIKTPSTNVKSAIFETNAIDTGPDGDNDTQRTLATLVPAQSSPSAQTRSMPEPTHGPASTRFDAINQAPVSANRKLYFSEVLSDPTNPNSPTNFFITTNKATPIVFSADNPPAITTTQGSVELWTIENRAQESHEFHIHQIHFQLREINGVAVPPNQRQYYDTFQVPYWSGSGPYPSITVAMDFRGEITGDFVYHCHILGHEDSGMMAIIRVLPKTN